MKTKSRNLIVVFLMALAFICGVFAITPLTANAAERDREIVEVESGNSLNMTVTNEGLLTWDTVTGATGYGISVNQNGMNIANFDTTNPFIVLMTEMDILKIDSGLYTIEVYAKGVSKRASMTYYYTSNVDKLESPSNLQWIGNQACWESVEGAVSYKLSLYSFDGQEFTTTTTSCLYDLSEYNPADGWTFKVQAESNGSLLDKRDSCVVESPAKGSRTRTINAVESGNSLNMTVTNEGILTWNAVNDATGYRIAIKQNGMEITYFETTYNVLAFISSIDGAKLSSGQYVIEVQPQGVAANSASMTYYYTSNVNQLESPYNLHWNGMQACWSAVDGAIVYDVTLYNFNGAVITVPTEEDYYDFEGNSPQDGWTFKVQARSNGTLNAPRHSVAQESPAKETTYAITCVAYEQNGLVSLETNKGSNDGISIILNATKNSEVTVTATPNAGYEFVAWRLTAPAQPEATCSTDATYTFNAISDIQIFAVFTNQYNVEYNGNGANGSMTGGVVNVNNERNQTFTLGECTFDTPTDKEFKGWAVGSVDAWPLKNAGDTIEIHADTTIYAIWENTYIIKAQPEDTSGKIGVNVPVSITLDITQIPDDSNEYIVLKVKNGDNWEQVSAMTRSSWVDSFHSSTGSFNVTSNTTGTKTYRYEVYDGTEWKISDTFDVEFLPLVVTFVDNEHSTVTEPINVYEYNTLITEPVIPTFAGDTFYGWGWPYWDFENQTVTQDTTLSAQWAGRGYYGNIPDVYALVNAKARIDLSNVNDNNQTYIYKYDGANWNQVVNVTNYGYYDLPASDVAKIETYKIVIKHSKDIESNEFTVNWVDALFTVSFNANDGTGTMNNVNFAGIYDLPVCEFEAPNGKRFAGWAIGSADALPIRLAGEKISISANTTIYAVWEEIPEYMIVYSTNGGEGSNDLDYAEEGSQITLATPQSLNFIAPDGKQFAGWAVGSVDALPLKQPGLKITINADTYIYAIWENIPVIPESLTATYTGTILAGTTINPSGISITLNYSDSSTEPVNAGAVEYWYNGQQITNPIAYVFGVELIGSLNITIKYEGLETTMAVQIVGHAITFNANGGTGEMTATEYVGAYTLPANEFTAPTGKQFKGWATSANGEVINETTYNVTEPVTLYAVWENIPAEPTGLTASYNGTILAGNKLAINQLTVKLQYSDSSEMPCAGLCEYWYNGSKIDDPINYVFGVELIGTITITVKYQGFETTFDVQVVGYEITFNANTGSGTMESVEYVGAYTLPACTFTAPNGKQFKGWSTSANGEVIDGATYNVTANVELFAIWEDIPVVKYDVTFNANGGTGTMSPVEYAGTYTLPTCAFTAPDGKQFKGWSTSANGEVIDGATYNVTANVELFAIWEDIPVANFNVTFNANGGTGTMSPVEYAGIYTLPTCTFTAPDGKQFKGWSTSANGEVIDGATYNVTSNVELFAIWEDIPHNHDYGTTWESDANNHWNECSCGDKANVGAHSDGNADGKCDTCDYQMGNGGAPENPEQPKDGLSGGAIAGIVVGSVVVLGLGGFALVWFVIKKKSFADLVAIFKKK